MQEQIKSYYEHYDEDGRLFRDKAHLPEWLTTIRYFNKLFAPNSRIFDACAGTGRYALYLADRGHRVTACDLVEHNVNILRAKPNADKLAAAAVCNVLDLSGFEENSFDVVLCMGALYHLPSDEEKIQAVRECVKVCKPGGLVVLSYLNYFALLAAEVHVGLDNLGSLLAAYENKEDFLFTPTTPARMARCAAAAGLDILHHIGADGLSFVLADKLNPAADEAFDKWMEYIYAHCEDPSILGYSMHGLLIGRKPV
ncbi:MAG: class I SAM-dependent methyltransferase [Oscillospiraceae bacterium]|nr:class I SAM-dependent methyltransferase [Oscillospiraceae bacterium]